MRQGSPRVSAVRRATVKIRNSELHYLATRTRLILIQHKSLSLSYRPRPPARDRALQSIQPLRVHPRERQEVVCLPRVLAGARQQRGVQQRRVPQALFDLELFRAREAAGCEFKNGPWSALGVQ